jgi:molybdenum cofactor synthesis domain-containing protein
MVDSAARIGILTVSDRASRGVYEDRGGPAIREYLDEVLSSPWEPVTRVVPDERGEIEDALEELCEQEGCCLVVTTGGTGPAARDVTPEATIACCSGTRCRWRWSVPSPAASSLTPDSRRSSFRVTSWSRGCSEPSAADRSCG